MSESFICLEIHVLFGRMSKNIWGFEHMARIVLLITKPPQSEEGAERMCGISKRAREHGMDVTIYMIGDGVLCTKKDQKGFIGQNLKMALENNISIIASGKDLKARAIPFDQVEPKIQIENELEDMFVDDIMEKADRVISW